MDSKQASSSDISDTLPGSSSVPNTIHPHNSEIETVDEANVLIDDGENNGSVNSSDDGGFVSGEEEFEPASERPVVVADAAGEGTLGKGTDGDDFVGSPDFVTPRAQILEFVAPVDDDVEGDSEVGNLGGEVVEEEGVVRVEESGVVDDLGSSPAVENGDSKPIDVAGYVEPETLAEPPAGENLNSGGVDGESGPFASKDGTIEELGATSGDGVAENSKLDEVGESLVPEEVAAVEGVNLNSEEAVEASKSEQSSSRAVEVNGGVVAIEESALSGDANQSNSEVTETAGTESVESLVKLTPEGDSIVEEINVDVKSSEPGVAVVGETEETKDSEIKAADLPVNGSTELDRSVDVKLTPEGDSVVEEINVDVKLSEPGVVAVVGETEETKDSEIKAADLPVNGSTELDKTVDVKLTSEGDSVVEEINVNLSEAGVAVVGEMEESKDSEIKAADFPVDGSAELDNGAGVKLTSEGDSVVEEIDVKLSEPGVAIVGETEGNKDSENKAMDFIVNGSVELDRSFDPLSDYNVKSAESEPMGQESDVLVADKVEDSDIGVVVTDDVSENNSNDVEKGENIDSVKKDKTLEAQIEQALDSDAKTNETREKVDTNGGEVVFGKESAGSDEDGNQALDANTKSVLVDPVHEENHQDNVPADADALENGVSAESQSTKITEASLVLQPEPVLGAEDEVSDYTDEEDGIEGSLSDGETDGMIFGSSEAAKQFMEELEQGSGTNSQLLAESSRDNSQRIDGRIVTDSDEEDDNDDGDGKELFDSAALAALLKAATGADSDGGNITITSQDGSRLFSVERPAGLGSSLASLRPGSRPSRPNLFTNSALTSGGRPENNLTDEEKKKLEMLQLLRVKFLRLVRRLGLSSEESIAAQVLYRLALVAGRQISEPFSLDAAKRTAMELEAEGRDDVDFSLNILVLGKSGVGKSATINSIFGEEKASIDAFEPATSAVKEISGTVDGVKIRVFDTPGLKSSAMEQAFNRRVLSSVKKFTKKSPPDVVLYVDRLDAQTRDLNDLPLLRTITGSLGQSIWRSAIVTLTHAASAPPDGPSGAPLSYEGFVTQRSHVVQHSIGQAVGDLRMMNPISMNPVSLVENHPLCRKNREGQKVLPNGQSWRPQLMLLCYSLKILAEANSFMKPQDPFDHRKLFGLRMRSPPLPYMLSSMLQTRAHPKLSADQGGENGDSDIDLDELSDSDQENEEDEYDQLPPFKPLRKSQIAKLSKEQRNAYFDEYEYRVKLLRKKQWREELRRLREFKKKGKDAVNDYGYLGEEDADQENSPAPVAVPLPDMVLPPSFDGENPAYRYRFLEPTSQFLARPVLDTHGWDHDCGYDGVNLEHSLAIASQFPAAIAVQLTKDKKEFSIHLDSSVSAKHGENGSTMAGFDIQQIGKQLAYIVRGETKFKNLRKNKTAAGVSVIFLGENVATGLKVEDQIVLGKQWALMGSAGTIRSQGDAAYGANLELQHRELDYPIGQVQSTYSLSLIKWRGDWALGLNTMAQFSVGRGSKVAVRAGLNNKLSGQITVRTSSSDHLSFALAGIIPIAINIYKKLWPAAGENYSIY